MASDLYPKAREGFLSGQINWFADTIKCCLVDTGVYTYSTSHEFLSSVTGIVATSAALTSKTVALGVADAADVTFSGVTGATVEAVVIYKDTGVASTSRLIAYIDTGTGLPVTPNGGDVVLAWDNGANRIFAL